MGEWLRQVRFRYLRRSPSRRTTASTSVLPWVRRSRLTTTTKRRSSSTGPSSRCASSTLQQRSSRHQQPEDLTGSKKMTNGTALAVRNGGSLRIHAGELGFQAERLAQNYSPPASAAGFCLSAHALENKRTTANPRDSHATQPPLVAGQFRPRFIASRPKGWPDP